ncbi:hypothetical protein [Ornithobacterium rhinotracheale]|uniref:hypothetical protein n=1 Tax=Ornithobacterium rhinotracheale TaxID=28251 RepID=UPI00387347BC
MILYLFAKNNPDSLENPAQVKAGIAKLIYRIKKQTISRFDLKSDDYKLLDNKINPVLRLILKENSPFSIGLQRYIGIIISLHYPFLFKLKSLFK